MGVYVKRPEKVEAIRFLEVTLAENLTHSIVFDEQENLPVWLRNALIDEVIFCTLNADDVTASLFVEILGRSVEVHPGDWIIFTPEDGFSVCAHVVFTFYYLPHPAAKV